MAKKALHIRFFLKAVEPSQRKTCNGWHVKHIHYRGDSIAECVLKAFNYIGTQGAITSFTILEGENRGQNTKMVDYGKELMPNGNFRLNIPRK